MSSRPRQSKLADDQEGREDQEGQVSNKIGRRRHTWEHVNPTQLESWRTKLGIGSKEAATRLGVSLSCYYNWLRGQNVPTPARQMEMRRVIEAPAESTVEPMIAGHVRPPSHCASISIADQVTAVFQSYVAAQPNALKPADVPSFLREIREALTG